VKKMLCALILGLVACNYDVGECWVRKQGKEGAGAGAISTPGDGDFGDVPLRPQDYTDSGDPCTGTVECTVHWKLGSSGCTGQGNSSGCTTKHQGQYNNLDQAKSECERVNGVHLGSGAESCDACQWAINVTNDCREACKEKCDRTWELCRRNCPNGDKACLSRCTDDYGRCLRDCGRRCK
jgi:hypothetical protein